MDPNSLTVYETALLLLSAGVSIVPIRPDRSKAPAVDTWKEFQAQRATPEQAEKWFAKSRRGIAVLGGAISGGLEILDFDLLGIYDLWQKACAQSGLEGVEDSLPLARTPSGGHQAYYRCPEAIDPETQFSEGNQKLAQHREGVQETDPGARHDDAGWYRLVTDIETRGEGGYAIVPPSPAWCHPANVPYEMIRGDLSNLPVLPLSVRDALLALAHGFNRWTIPVVGHPGPTGDSDGERPGDKYNAIGDYESLLEVHGARPVGRRGQIGYWRRPGKTGTGTSGTTGHGTERGFYCFSSNWTPFEPDTGYSPFAVYTLLEHGGDFGAAARKLLEDPAYREEVIDFADRVARTPNNRSSGTVRADLPGSPFVEEEAEEEEALGPDSTLDVDLYPAYPYCVRRKRSMYIRMTGGGNNRHPELMPIADFYATITQEAMTEDGRRIWTLEGRTAQKQEFSVDVDGKQFADAKTLKSTLANAVGPLAPVHPKMDVYLGPCIQLLTRHYGSYERVRRYERCGWKDARCDEFLIPGWELKNTEVKIPSSLPYCLPETADLGRGQEALLELMQAKPAGFSTVMLSAILGPPVARLAGWRKTRKYFLHVTGRTTSYKTTMTSLFMSLWGSEFVNDALLTKWGDGATSNALLHLATYACDLPYFVDNYKPNTGGGVRAFVSLIHNLVEGSEKQRMTKTIEMRQTREIHCWPIFTGEDLPESDEATIGRALVVETTRDDMEIEHLSRAQDLSDDLCAVGRAFLIWLCSDEGLAVVREESEAYGPRRAYWRAILSARGRSGNSRIASNLTTNETIAAILARCPAIKDIWQAVCPFGYEHQSALELIATNQCSTAVESSEMHRFLAIVRAGLGSGRATLAPKGQAMSGMTDQERVIGWRDSDESIYLDDVLTLAFIERLRGREYLNSVSMSKIRRDLKGIGALKSHDKNRLTKQIRLDTGGRADTTHIAKEFVLASLEMGEEEAPQP